ncbi:MAG: dTDP-4-dehydrorhamnose 3,5-epimerase [Rhodoferax sp.]|uniref:dTDP-4-dehydrorhamnose 3,5-epimerase n=1 Tax=Rhodoferax sp. TaxID=50421 RepID=UPI00271B0F9C|nr:dTDP-4-dehydrorhamnose 3,5-epimerase [Rhodoferax sp.]MDO8450279.1 dTDP-4-dehydrorhamnose 3,5-epimerase [Rhodoferax sp.]
MRFTPTAIPEVLTIEPQVFADERGFFYESFNQREFDQAVGLNLPFVQDNHSHSVRGVLRGLHYQIQQPQGKLVRVVRGAIFDVAVDIRQGSATFGQWVGNVLTEYNHLMSWIPAGFAHGFLVTSESADVLYKTTAYYAPQFECCIAWDDPALAIAWPLAGNSPLLSTKDQSGVLLANALMSAGASRSSSGG